MAQLKTDKITLTKDFQIDLGYGWILGIDVQCVPTNYTLTHGKKSINFNSDVMKTLFSSIWCSVSTRKKADGCSITHIAKHRRTCTFSSLV